MAFGRRALLLAVTLASAARAEPAPFRWRGTQLVWIQSLTTQTVGLGADVQTTNPTWDGGYLLRPRYALYVDPRQAVSLRAEVGVTRELTNSDVTTRRGEWSLTDALLFGSYVRVLREAGPVGPAPMTPSGVIVPELSEQETAVGLRLPVLTFPTSTKSYSSGMWLGVGLTAAVMQSLPVLGYRSPWLPGADLSLTLGYTYLLTESAEPTGTGFARTRMGPDGNPVVSDQLGGAAFAAHQLLGALDATLYVTRRLSWSTTLAARPSFHYGFRHDEQLCGVVATGCITIRSVDHPSRYTVVTQFSTGVGARVLDVLGLWLGYTNLTAELGPSGRRRNLLYSPDARFELDVTLHLDVLALTAMGRPRGAPGEAVAR